MLRVIAIINLVSLNKLFIYRLTTELEFYTWAGMYRFTPNIFDIIILPLITAECNNFISVSGCIIDIF